MFPRVEAHDPLIGQTVAGRYVVKRFLGKGAMGEVYEADDTSLGTRVAIKFLPDGSDGDAKRRFHREARAASAVDHEHVVRVFEVGAAGGREYFTMELVDGKELQKVLDYEGALEPERAVAIGTQILAGLSAIHAAGLVHRDIKPGNIILVARDGRELAKIMDFGVSKTIARGDDTITSLGRVVGTPQFMAPEQIAGGTVDHRADLYATGIAMYAMLSGKVPFGGTNVTKVAQQHLVERPASLATLRPGLPAVAVAAVARALEKDPEDRFQSAQDFADALAGKDIPARPRIGAVTKRDRPEREAREHRLRVPLVVALVGIGALVALAMYSLL
jgi:serine/threonine protein kinase